RIFLDWSEPCLPQVVKVLRDIAEGGYSLSEWTCVLPGGRAARRLLELLVLEVEHRGGVLEPPRFVTASQLPELLLPRTPPPAGRLQRAVSWMSALQSVAPETLRSV